jgi:hypothetical protein
MFIFTGPVVKVLDGEVHLNKKLAKYLIQLQVYRVTS